MTQPSAAPTSPSARDAQDGSIGHKDEPTRVLSFASGGFETTRQLGAVHALLVSRARAPDMVIGASAGAINAVAAAEILQAGRCEARVARFREIFESYQNCPGDLADAMLPDTYEIDVHRPLEQLRLPMHAKTERESRGTSLDSKAGLLNLYNDLLRLRISIGTATRFIRRYLGLAAAGAEPNPLKRWLARLLELFRTWVLVGYNLAEGQLELWGMESAEAAIPGHSAGSPPVTRGPALQHAIDRVRSRWGARGLTRGTAVLEAQ
jgi:hypothetical protein